MKRSSVTWVAVAARASGSAPPSDQPRRQHGSWLLWHDGAAYLVYGPGEQPAPDGLADGGRAVVTVPSKETGGRLATWVASVTRVDPGSETWATVVPLLLGKRLNLRDRDTAARRWAATCTVLALTPTGEILEGPGADQRGCR